jgi:hypothetical protein
MHGRIALPQQQQQWQQQQQQDRRRYCRDATMPVGACRCQAYCGSTDKQLTLHVSGFLQTKSYYLLLDMGRDEMVLEWIRTLLQCIK